MFPDYYWNLVLIAAILGVFVASQLWAMRQIERDTPPREGEHH